MFSEDFLEIINKTEKAYNAQNVSEIVKRAGRKEKITLQKNKKYLIIV